MSNPPIQDSKIVLSEKIVLKPLTDETDLPALIDLCMKALEPDALIRWRDLFTEKSELESAITALNEAYVDPNHYFVKAVLISPQKTSHGGEGEKKEEQEEKLVGFANWMEGYITLDKVDPFAPREAKDVTTTTAASQNGNDGEITTTKKELGQVQRKETSDGTSNMAEEKLQQEVESLIDSQPPTTTLTTTTKEDEEERTRRLKFGESTIIDARNYYIMSIRGKKHMYIRRLMVHPDYQHRGIGAKMLKHITDQADEKKIVTWLFSRPAGEALYRRFGFDDVHTTKMDFGDFKCPPIVGMLRSPVPILSNS